MSTYGLAILVESLGDRSQSPPDTEYRYAWCTELASDMDPQLAFPVLRNIPNEISVSTDFVNSTATVGGMSFDLDGASTEVSKRFFVQRTVKISNLSVALNLTNTIVWLENDDGTADTTQAGKTIILGREAIYLATHAGGGEYTYPEWCRRR